MRIGATSRPVDIQEGEAQIAQLKREQDYATSRKRFDEAKQFEEQINAKQKSVDEKMEAWQRKTGPETLEVTVESVAESCRGSPASRFPNSRRKNARSC